MSRAYDFDPADPLQDLGRAMIAAFVRESSATTPRQARVLDLGAGEAAYRSFFTHCRYVALDRAIGDAEWAYTHLDVIADAEMLPFAEETFDAVVMIELLEHVRRPAAIAADTRRVLRRGGSLFLTAPMAHPLHQEPHDYFRFTVHGLCALLHEAGFHTVEAVPFGGLFTRWAYELPRALDTLPPSAILRGTRSMRGWLMLPLRVAFRFLLRPLQRFLLVLERFDTDKKDPLGWRVIAR